MDIRGRLQDKIKFGSEYPGLPYEQIFKEWPVLGQKRRGHGNNHARECRTGAGFVKTLAASCLESFREGANHTGA